MLVLLKDILLELKGRYHDGILTIAGFESWNELNLNSYLNLKSSNFTDRRDQN